MANLVTARLGSIEFSVPAGSLSQIGRDTSWRVDVPEPMEGLGKPVARGRGSDRITLEGVVFPGWSGTRDSVQRLRDAGDAGESMLLVDGEGTIYGAWMIVRLSERKSHFLPDGVERRAEWNLTIEADPDGELL